AVAFEEHVLGPAQADAFSTESDGLGRFFRLVRVGANAELAIFVRPGHQLGELLVDLRLFGFERLINEDLDDFARSGGDLTGEYFTGESVDADPVAVLQDLVADGHRAFRVIDVEGAAADDTDLTHLPAHESGMARSATERRQNSVSYLHPANILGTGLP